MLIVPPAPTGTIARFATVWPGAKMRVGVAGRVDPVGYSVTYPALVGPTRVVLITTAETPVAGTPPRPVTCRSAMPPGPSEPAPERLRKSRIRAGSTGLKRPRAEAVFGVVK